MARILVADDMKGIIKAVERILLSEGHDVTTCSDGQEAIDKIEKDSFDLVITDILMPEKDGMEVAKHIRTKLPKDRQSTPILAVTGGGTLMTSEMAIEAAKMHANELLLKPFDSHSFKEVITKLLG